MLAGIIFTIVFYQPKYLFVATHLFGLALVAYCIMANATQPALLRLPLELPGMIREYKAGVYGVAAAVAAKLAVDIVMSFLAVSAALLGIYVGLGMHANLVYLLGVGWLLAMASSSVAMTLTCVFGDLKVAIHFAPILYVMHYSW